MKSSESVGSGSVAPPAQLIVYGRAKCHLCEEMITALQRLQKQVPFNFEVVDIDYDPELKSLYNDYVPVLMALPGQQEICHYHLDVTALNTYLAETC